MHNDSAMIESSENLIPQKNSNNKISTINQPNKTTFFNGLKVKSHLDFNFTFFFNNSDSECKLNSVVLSLKAIDNQIITTFYYKKREKRFSLTNANPEIKKYYDHIIWHEDEDHKDHFHKRLLPLEDHAHFSSKKPSLNDGSFANFLNISFKEALVNKLSKQEFEYATSFLIENPSEPGISFSSGCYAQNGGSKDIRDKLAEDEQYIQGPFQQFTTPDAS